MLQTSSILAHMNFTKEKGSTPQAHIIKASEYFQKMHPEDVERIQQIHKNLASGKLQHAKEEFRIITEVEERKFTYKTQNKLSVNYKTFCTDFTSINIKQNVNLEYKNKYFYICN